MMRVWHYWMVTRWTVAPEHHSLEIRPLAAIFTLLLQKKKLGEKKQEKRKPWKNSTPTPKEQAARNTELCFFSLHRIHHFQLPGWCSYKGPLNWFPDRCCLMEGLELAASPSFRQTTCKKKNKGLGRESQDFLFFFLMSKPQSHWGTADFFNCSLKARTSPFLELGCSSRQGHWMASLHQFPRKRHIDGFF